MTEGVIAMAQDQKVAVYVKRATLAIDKYSNQLLAAHDMTNAQYKVLKYILGHAGSPVRSADLEAHFNMTNPTATGIIQNLERKGLIRRVPNPQDGRSKLLEPTEYAHSIEEQLYRIGEEIEGHVTANLTEAERKELIRLLVKMLGRE